jgi:putative transcriptional regulator
MSVYHYTECGLDNVYIKNGFEIKGEEVYIKRLHELHKAILKTLISKASILSGKEITFIRHYLDLSQKTFGRMLGVDYQTILRWEKEKGNVTKTADILIKMLILSYLKNKSAYNKINEIADSDEEDNIKIQFEFDKKANIWPKSA